MTSAVRHSSGEPHGHSRPAPHHAINYLMIFLTLVALTVITVAVAFERFDNELINVLMALLIASIKGMFVARYFMHLKFEGKLIAGILLVPLALSIIMVIALIPDIGRGRQGEFNDTVAMFESAVGGNGSHP